MKNIVVRVDIRGGKNNSGSVTLPSKNIALCYNAVKELLSTVPQKTDLPITEKPSSICVCVNKLIDRKSVQTSTFTVYNTTANELKKVLSLLKV